MSKVLSNLFRFTLILSLLTIYTGMLNAQSKSKKKKVQVIQVDTARIVKIPPRKAPIVPFRDTIFYVYGNIGSFTPEQRALAINERIQVMEEDYYYHEDLVNLVAEINGNINIVYRNEVIATVDTVLAEGIGKSRVETAELFRDEIVKSINKQRDETSFRRIAIQILLVAIILIAEYFLLKGLFYLYRRAIIYARLQRGKKIKGMFNIIDAQRELYLIIYIAKLIRFVLIIISLYLCVWALFKVFPGTMALADTLLGYVLTPLTAILVKVKNYMPKLFTIIVIVVIFWYIRKLLRSVTEKIADSSINIRGFYPDWAFPTFNIISAILFVFMFIMIYPYLPESDSSIFQGVSVFAGLLISLGSTSVIGNLVAGLVITYMRPFRVGDRVKMDDCVGNVIEKTALVTRVRTPKNEVITIPNSSVMSSKTVNYSQSAREYGLILYTSVTIGYDVPWQKVHELLLKVAHETDHVLKKQKPFILQNALNDFYVEYQLNVYTKEADRMASIYSDLRKNIQNVFGEAGIELLSPHYQVYRNMDEEDHSQHKPSSSKKEEDEE